MRLALVFSCSRPITYIPIMTTLNTEQSRAYILCSFLLNNFDCLEIKQSVCVSEEEIYIFRSLLFLFRKFLLRRASCWLSGGKTITTIHRFLLFRVCFSFHLSNDSKQKISWGLVASTTFLTSESWSISLSQHGEIAVFWCCLRQSKLGYKSTWNENEMKNSANFNYKVLMENFAPS